MLKYRAPIYFFVSRGDTLLAQRLEKGLRMAIDDGSFDDYFYNSPINKPIFASNKLKGRKIFELNNPLLSPQTPLSELKLWYKDEG